jgi:hypothetical protein
VNYKFACYKQDFEKLDAFTRQRLRRYLIKNKDQKEKTGNLVLTNKKLEVLGLKSLVEIHPVRWRSHLSNGVKKNMPQKRDIFLRKKQKASLKLAT